MKSAVAFGLNRNNQVDEVILEGQRYFVGSMVPKDSTRKKKTTLLERTRNVLEQLAIASVIDCRIRIFFVLFHFVCKRL